MDHPAGDRPKKPTHRGLGSIYRRPVTAEEGEWHIQFSVNGKRFRESTHTESYNEAQNFLKRRITEVSTGKFHGLKIEKTQLADILNDVIADYQLKDRHSLDSMARNVINKHVRPYFGRMRASNVTVPIITSYVRERKQAGAATASINRELSMLRRAFKLGVINRRVGAAHVPEFSQVMQREQNARQGFWEHDEYLRFREALPPDERPVFIFGYWTGCRFGEIVAIEWSQVDLPGRAVRLRADQTKPGEARIIPLGGPGADLYDMLLEQQKRHAELCPETSWVFFRQGRGDVTRDSARRGRQIEDIRKGWAKAVEETGINKLFHDLRRTGIRNLIRAGVTERVAMLISGHKTQSVFQRYNIINEDDLHAAADKLVCFVRKTAPVEQCSSCGTRKPRTRTDNGVMFCDHCDKPIADSAG